MSDKKITVYHKNHCVPCQLTMRQFDNAKLEYDTINIEEDVNVLQKLKTAGWQRTPVVVVQDVTGKIVDEWSGFQIDHIRQLIAN